MKPPCSDTYCNQRSDPQTLNYLPFFQVLKNDLIQIRLILIGIPDTIGIDHRNRPLITTVEATGPVHAHPALPGNPQFFGLFLGIRAQLISTVLLTAIPVLTLIHAHKKMTLVIRHIVRYFGSIFRSTFPV